MKTKYALLATVMAMATGAMGAANAQTSYKVHEEFSLGGVFDATITFSSDYSTVLGVNGSLTNPFNDPNPHAVTGVDTDYHTFPGFPGVTGVSLTGPDGFPFGYMLSLAWSHNASGATLPQFIYYSHDDGGGMQVDWYANSINGNDPATVLRISAVPEPASYAMLLGGLGLLGVARRRKRAN